MRSVSEAEELRECGGVCSVLRIVEEPEFFPGVGAARSEDKTTPVYGARFATSIIGVIAF